MKRSRLGDGCIWDRASVGVGILVCAFSSCGQSCQPYWAHVPPPRESLVGGITAFDDGNGSALFIGGCFGTGAGVSRWDGGGWHGLSTNGLPPNVYCTGAPTVLNGGDGPHLYVGAVGQVGG